MPSTEPEQTSVSELFIHIAAGIVENARGEILIAKRPDHLHQGGLWEFPGGKVESGEDVFTALKRELAEEVSLEITSAAPLIQIPWHYPAKSVMLDVLRVLNYSGEAEGLEGQTVKWVEKSQLNKYDFPPANDGIAKALNLPSAYMITGQFDQLDDFKARLEQCFRKGIRLVQLRAKHLSDNELGQYIRYARQRCDANNAMLLVNSQPEIACEHNIGLHLSSRYLSELTERPIAKNLLLAASVHNELELQQAIQIDVDFVVVSPVKQTPSHPDALPMGWEKFSEICKKSTVPVYALGGMSEDDLENSRSAGAQGIAAISCFWN